MKALLIQMNLPTVFMKPHYLVTLGRDDCTGVSAMTNLRLEADLVGLEELLDKRKHRHSYQSKEDI